MMAIDTARALGKKGQATRPQPSTIPIEVQFHGGLNEVFAGKRALNVALPVSSSRPATAGDLITHLTETSIPNKSKKNLFTTDGTVTPGILVVINEADWDVDDKENTELNAGDEVVFISTLHGG